MIASTWVHMLLLAGGAVLNSADPSAERTAPMQITRIDASELASPHPSARDLADAPATAPVTPPEPDPSQDPASTPVRQAAPEIAPEPDADAPRPPDPIDWQRFAPIDQPQGRAPSEATWIAAFDASAAERSRALVTAREAGPMTRSEEGAVAQPGSAEPKLHRGDPVDPAGSPEQQAVTRVDAPTGGGGGARGEDGGRGAPDHAGQRVAGGAAAPAGGEQGDEGQAAPAVAAEGAALGFAAAIAGQRHAGSRDPATASDAARTKATPREPTETQDGPQSPSAVQRDGRAAAERAGDQLDEGAASGTASERAAPGPEGALAKAAIAALQQGRIESTEELRHSLGFGELDRSTLAPRSASPGQDGQDGTRPTSPQLVQHDVALSDVVFADARTSEEGKYAQRVYQILRDGWYDKDLDPHSKARGIQGQVAVTFHITASGRVDEVDVTASSGNTALDALARSAVPDRLPRVPPGVGDGGVWMQWTFAYRNPLIEPLASGDRP